MVWTLLIVQINQIRIPLNLPLDLPLAADDVVKRALASNEAGQEDHGQEDEVEGTHGHQAAVDCSGNLRQLWDSLLMSS